MSDFNYSELSEKAAAVLRQAFSNSAVIAEEGWHGRVHLKIVSPAFDKLPERRKQDLVWDVLRSELGPESQGVSLVLAFGMDEV